LRQLQLERAHEFVLCFAFLLRHAERIAKLFEMQSHLPHLVPLCVFFGLLALWQLLSGSSQTFALRHAEFWIYPGRAILHGRLRDRGSLVFMALHVLLKA
jgi:hypothetical protein